ncbi:hypothetical protein FEM03_07470 [Phragmitibacter flavus]|uniref:Multi-ubiquitin domain-containing protein n=1 Tax=Phragmitibacter flavus TaxID=2576071 RepID=A0A5R8KGK3_9BACT|nr:multiubiquitin domain-containing protein [Phragmitibacter flavus]TLD71361.1 hypothetical protein FEM03_07470 [Phragmitibacter flavus]
MNTLNDNTPSQSGTDNPSAKWASVVSDRLILMPRRRVSALLVSEQAGLKLGSVLIRDRVSGDDEVLEHDVEVDLADGNVFRVASSCDCASKPNPKLGEPKLAFVVDDRFKEVTNPSQTENGLRRLFGLDPRVELLRDMESPNDTPIDENETVRFKEGPVFVSCVEIEKHCKGTEGPPDARRYIIRVRDKRVVVPKPNPTGREILKLAGFDPAKILLNQRIGKRTVPVALDATVDLTACGIERFTTLPNEQGEGRPTQDFSLPEDDVEQLNAQNLSWQAITDKGTNWLIINNVPLPDVFHGEPTDVAIRILPGYPATALDMAYFHPPVRRKDGRPINCTEGTAGIRAKSWQQWSRHYSSANPWKPGEFNVLTHYLLSLAWLEREAAKA